MSTIGERLKNARELNHLTQSRVYKDTGIHNKTLSGYERNLSEPDLDTFKKLAEYYDVDVNYLMGITDDPKHRIKVILGSFNNIDESLSILDFLESYDKRSEIIFMRRFLKLSSESQRDLIDYLELLELRDLQKNNQNETSEKNS